MAFHQYNTFQYNTSQYNADVRTWFQALLESVGASDSKVDSPTKALAEALAASDVLAKLSTKAFDEAVSSIDACSRAFHPAAMAEMLRLNDWLSIVRVASGWNQDTPHSGNWSN